MNSQFDVPGLSYKESHYYTAYDGKKYVFADLGHYERFKMLDYQMRSTNESYSSALTLSRFNNLYGSPSNQLHDYYHRQTIGNPFVESPVLKGAKKYDRRLLLLKKV